jgi:hypothetical protein
VELGYGGISRVSRACGLSRVTLTKGVEELRSKPLEPGRIRREGGGRHALSSNDPGLAPALDSLVEPTTRGDPESPLRWTLKSSRTLAAELTVRRHPVSHTKVTQLLRQGGYSLQGNRKTEEGDDHPDRDAQFRHIGRAVKRTLRAGDPVISVDTKKKELIGNYQNRGRQWRKAKTADKVNGHDFPSPEVPRAYPYGIYDLGRNTGFVNVGTDHDTGAFALASIRGWWRAEGIRLYPGSDRRHCDVSPFVTFGICDWRRNQRAWARLSISRRSHSNNGLRRVCHRTNSEGKKKQFAGCDILFQIQSEIGRRLGWLHNCPCPRQTNLDGTLLNARHLARSQ